MSQRIPLECRKRGKASRLPAFGNLQKALEDRGITPLSAESEYIPVTPTELPENQAAEVLALVDRLEQDDDVQKVFHNLG